MNHLRLVHLIFIPSWLTTYVRMFDQAIHLGNQTIFVAIGFSFENT